MTIYKIVHLPTCRVYIGQTTSAPEIRLSKHKSLLRKGRHSNPYLQSVFNKYGEGDFVFSPVCRAHNLEHLNALEKRLIILFKADVSLGGFNLREGGGNGKLSEDTKKRMSLAAMGNTKGRAGKGVSRPNGLIGKPKPDSVRKKISEALRGRVIPEDARVKAAQGHFKRVKQLSLDGEELNVFASLKEAALKTGANKSMISQCINGKKKTSGGFRWQKV